MKRGKKAQEAAAEGSDDTTSGTRPLSLHSHTRLELFNTDNILHFPSFPHSPHKESQEREGTRSPGSLRRPSRPNDQQRWTTGQHEDHLLERRWPEGLGEKEWSRCELTLLLSCLSVTSSANQRTCSSVCFLQWVREEDPDVLCLQETKCAKKDLPAQITEMPEYPHKYWASSDEKGGYSGVAMLCKTEPLKVTYGIGEYS